MSQDKNEDQDFDEGALAALLRPSLAPPAASEDLEDDGKIDLRALVASSPPPATEAPVEAAPASAKAEAASTKAATAKADAPSASKSGAGDKNKNKKKAAAASATAVAAAATLPAEVAQPAPAKSGNGVWIGVAIGAAAACVGMYFAMTSSQSAAGTEVAADHGPSTTTVGSA
ncbi:MAG: hypothetical protein M3Y87_09790, partial [Myxococcota bacterium]|nr:hypothetical protein [Myxococcota bacterium]